MPALNSSVLILGLPSLPELQVGADAVVHWKNQVSHLALGSYDVVCAPLEEMKSNEFESLVTFLLQKNPTLQIVMVSDEDSSTADMQKVFERYPVFRVACRSALQELEKDLVFGLEEAQMAQQNKN